MNINKTCAYVKHNNKFVPYYFLKLLECDRHKTREMFEDIRDLYEKGEITLKEKSSDNKLFFEYVISPYELWDKNAMGSENINKNNEYYENLYLKTFIFDYVKVFSKEILELKNSSGQCFVNLLGGFELKKILQKYNDEERDVFLKINFDSIDLDNLHCVTNILTIDFLENDDIYCLDVLINKIGIDLTVSIKTPPILLYKYIKNSLLTHDSLGYTQVKYYHMFKDKISYAESLYEKKKLISNIKIEDKDKDKETEDINKEEVFTKRL